MATRTDAFTAVGAGGLFGVRDGDRFTYAVSGTFVGTWVLEKSENGGAAWEQVDTGTGTKSSTTVDVRNTKTAGADAHFRFRCAAFTSGQIDTELSDAESGIVTPETALVDTDGTPRAVAREGGLDVTGDLDVSEDLSVAGTAAFTGAASFAAAVNEAKGTDVASAATVNLDSATGNWVNITGTTQITAITLSAGRRRMVRFAGSLVLTHGASLVLPGAANITTAAGDWAILVGDASGVVRCVQYFRNASLPATQAGTETLTNKTLTAPTVDTLKCTGGVGAKNGATVSVVEQGDGNIHKTVLTLTATPLPIVSVGAGNGVGGVKLYDFPEGRICVLGTMADLSLAVAAGKQADFTDATPEGDVGIGTVAPANDDAFGTDATDDDFATGQAFTMSAYAATAKCQSEPVQQMDGTATPKDLYLNGLVDAADIDDDVSTEIEVTGTVTVVWVNLGDF